MSRGVCPDGRDYKAISPLVPKPSLQPPDTTACLHFQPPFPLTLQVQRQPHTPACASHRVITSLPGQRRRSLRGFDLWQILSESDFQAPPFVRHWSISHTTQMATGYRTCHYRVSKHSQSSMGTYARCGHAVNLHKLKRPIPFPSDAIFPQAETPPSCRTSEPSALK